ncbi:MAG TPA: hypothetical protein VGG33_19570, partial [Polyangia bacterium]
MSVVTIGEKDFFGSVILAPREETLPHVDNLSPSLLGAREALNQDNLCPDDRREDWSLLLPQIRSLRDTVLTAVARADTLTPDERAVTTTLIGPLAAVLYASGEKVAASELILAALPVAPDPETQSLWTSGERYLPAFVDLERARYHLRRGERDEAVRAAAAVDDHPAEPLAKAARVITGRKGHAPAARTWGAAHNRSYWPGAAGFGALLAVLVGILYLLSPNRTVSREFRALGAAPTGVALSPDARDQRLTQLESLIDRE